jgi:hypothetical protein
MFSFCTTTLARLGALGALLLSGCTLLPSVAPGPTFRADALVGADTWSFTDLTLRPSVQQALYLRDVMDLLNGSATAAGVDLHHLHTPSGRMVDFEQDLLPHLDGEVVVTVNGPADEPHYMVLIHTNDVEGTLRLLSDETQKLLTKDSRGAMYYEPQRGTDFVVGYKNWVFYTNSSALRDQTLDRIDGKGTPSLATEARYRSVVERLAGDRFGFGYLDIAPLLERVSKDDARLTSALQAKGRMAYSIGIEEVPAAGVRALGMRMEFMPDQALTLGKVSSGDALEAMDRLPRGSMLAFAGSNLGLYAESFAALSEDEQVFGELHALLGLFAGPYALGVTPPSVEARGGGEGLGAALGGLFFVAKLAPDVDVDQLGATLTDIAETAAAKASDSDTWDSATVVDDGWLAVNAVPAPASLDQLPQDLLASDRMYQWVRPGFVRDGTNAYVNLVAVEAAFAGDLLSGDNLAALSPIQAIGIAGQTDGQGDSHAHIQVLLLSR